ncbi:MAG TPA: hypothetical protein VKT71_01555 [Candidatus Acidoferrales bacterium]|nr:hypothetical protein [Candidatus Acidoferrales bacterium]
MMEMTCREFDEIVHAFVRMELLDVNLREAALEHAAHCELCSERLADAAALLEASDTMARNWRNEETPAHVESGLLASFRHHHRRASWRRTLEWATVGAAAAVLLIFLWTTGSRSRVQAPQVPRKDVSSQTEMPQDAKATEAPKLGTPELFAQAAVPDAAAANETYVASDFVPVPYTGTISADDPGMIVRVQLTRSSLAQLGYPVAEAPDEDLILADVLVGEDGWPRGVKLIQ